MGGSTVLVSRLLERLADEDAVLILTEAAATLPPDGTLLLVEQIRPTDLDDIDATLQHLRLACLFGSGLRSLDELSALAVRAGLRGTPLRRHRLGPPAVGAGALHRTVTPGPAGTGVRNGVMRARCGRVAGPATGFRPTRRAA